MKVYAVSEGQYSDWRIVGLFTTQPEADKAKKMLEEFREDDWCPYTDVSVYEFDLLETADQPRTIYISLVDKNGKEYYRQQKVAIPWDCDEIESRSVGAYAKGVSLVSPEHALKTARDLMYQWLHDLSEKT